MSKFIKVEVSAQEELESDILKFNEEIEIILDQIEKQHHISTYRQRCVVRLYVEDIKKARAQLAADEVRYLENIACSIGCSSN